MQRYEVLREDCIGGFLAVSRLFREETRHWLEARRIRGWKWEAHNGDGQAVARECKKIRAEMTRREFMDYRGSAFWTRCVVSGRQCYAGREGFEEQRTGNRKDVRKLLGSVYRFPRVWNAETLRADILDQLPAEDSED